MISLYDSRSSFSINLRCVVKLSDVTKVGASDGKHTNHQTNKMRVVEMRGVQFMLYLRF